MSKIKFQPVISTRQIHSFPKMYNTMGSKMDGLAVREHFLSKIAEKTAFWAARFSDHLTSERSGVLPSPCFPNFLARTTFVLESLSEVKNPGKDAIFGDFLFNSSNIAYIR